MRQKTALLTVHPVLTCCNFTENLIDSNMLSTFWKIVLVLKDIYKVPNFPCQMAMCKLSLSGGVVLFQTF